jgi:hypothetical protein
MNDWYPGEPIQVQAARANKLRAYDSETLRLLDSGTQQVYFLRLLIFKKTNNLSQNCNVPYHVPFPSLEPLRTTKILTTKILIAPLSLNQDSAKYEGSQDSAKYENFNSLETNPEEITPNFTVPFATPPSPVYNSLETNPEEITPNFAVPLATPPSPVHCSQVLFPSTPPLTPLTTSQPPFAPQPTPSFAVGPSGPFTEGVRSPTQELPVLQNLQSLHQRGRKRTNPESAGHVLSPIQTEVKDTNAQLTQNKRRRNQKLTTEEQRARWREAQQRRQQKLRGFEQRHAQLQGLERENRELKEQLQREQAARTQAELVQAQLQAQLAALLQHSNFLPAA